MTANASSRKSKTPRSLRLLAWTKAIATGGFLSIAEGKKEDRYEIAEIASDFGRGFRVQKFAVVEGEIRREEAYHVNLDGDGDTCECKGNLRFGYCRHVEAMKTLVRCGKI